MAFITNAEGNFFVQTNREDVFQWLTCTGVGDIGIPEGDRTPVECPDPLNSGLFKIDGFIRGTPGAGTYNLNKPLVRVFNFLLEQKCDFQGRINWVARGLRADPNNYELGVILHRSEFTSRTIVNPVARSGDEEERIDTTADIDYIHIMPFYPLRVVEHTASNTGDALSVFFFPERCEDRFGPARDVLEYGIVGLSNGIYTAEVKITKDGSTWAATDGVPFDEDGDVAAVLGMESIEGEVLIVFRGTAGIGPAECSISTDDGDTWTNVEIGEEDTQYILDAVMRSADIVVVASDGYIYVSRDGGYTWEAATSGGLTAENLNGIAFYEEDYGYAVGDDNTFLYTASAADGADATWATRTGPAVATNLLSVAVNDKGHVFVGANDGVLYVSRDEGVNWETAVNLGPGSVDRIVFDPYMNYVAALIYNDAGGEGHLYRSLDGGVSFQEVTDVPTNSGLSDVHIVDANRMFIVGDAHNGTTFLAEVQAT